MHPYGRLTHTGAVDFWVVGHVVGGKEDRRHLKGSAGVSFSSLKGGHENGTHICSACGKCIMEYLGNTYLRSSYATFTTVVSKMRVLAPY